MAMWDPEAAGNAAIYLRLPDIELIDIRNAPFEGKTAVWIPYSETGYTTGKRLGEEQDPKTKKNKIKVLREVDGKEKLYDESQVEPRNPPKYGNLIFYTILLFSLVENVNEHLTASFLNRIIKIAI